MTLLMGRVGRRRLLLLLRVRRVPVGRIGCRRRSPLVRRWATGWDASGARWSAGSRPVVRAPLTLGTLLRGILAAILALALPATGIHLRSLLVGRVRLLVLLKVGMPPRLVGLILSVVVRLLGRLRGRSRITLSRRRRSRSTWGSTHGWLLLVCCAGWSSGRWRLRRATLTLSRNARDRWRLSLAVRSLLRRRRIRTTSVAPVGVTSSRWCRSRSRRS